jgi:hypothetical protein
MWKWTLVIIIAIFLGGCLWLGYKNYQLSENIAWSNCIKIADPSTAPNLVCKSLYPRPYKLWNAEFYK